MLSWPNFKILGLIAIMGGLKSIPENFTQYASIAEAITNLFSPHVEVVIHDFKTDKIIGVWNSFSNRRVGDDSLQDGESESYHDEFVIGPYEKTGLHGEKIKSITSVLYNNAQNDKPIGLFCINLNVSHLDVVFKSLSSFLSMEQVQPQKLFVHDWREDIQTVAHNWLKERDLTASQLTKKEKIKLVAELDFLGLFEAKNAVKHVSVILGGSSRATVYNYLSEARENSNKNSRIDKS